MKDKKAGFRVKKSRRRKKNIDGNFRGAEDIFFIKISNGIKKFLETPFKK